MTFTGNSIYSNKGLKVFDSGNSIYASAKIDVSFQATKHVNGKLDNVGSKKRLHLTELGQHI